MQKPKAKRRNIMRAFKLTEISAVDRPAQQGARAMIMKRDSLEDTMDDMDLIEERAAELRAEGYAPTAAFRKARLDLAKCDCCGDDEIVTEDNFERLGKAEFDKAVDDLCREYEISRTDAMREIRKSQPWLYWAQNGVTPDRIPEDTFEKAGQDKSQFDLKVEGIKASENCSGTEALRRARTRHPDLYRAAQSAPVGKSVTELAGMPSEEMIAGDQAKKAWNDAVKAEQDRMARVAGKSVSFTAAMTEARKSNPDLWKAYQEIALPNPILRGRTV
jgi:hypothetical protein